MSVSITGFSRNIQFIISGTTTLVPKYLASVYTSSTQVGVVYYSEGFGSTQEIIQFNYAAVTSQTFSNSSQAAEYIQNLIDGDQQFGTSYIMFSGITASGNTPSYISNLTAVTVSASTFFSGSTNLYDLLTQSSNQTYIQNGLNTYTGGTNTRPTINISGLTVQDIIATGTSYFNIFSASTFSAGTISSLNTTIGNAEDGSYTDGLFTDFTTGTTIGTAVDRFNELFKAIAPSPAPNLSTLSGTTAPATGAFVTGNLSYGATKSIAGYNNVTGIGGATSVALNGTFTFNSPTGIRRGIVGTAGTTILSLLNSGTAASTTTPTPAYPAFSFGNGDSGSLSLIHNGSTVITSLSLSGFTGATAITVGNYTLSVNGSESVKFPLGTSLDLFRYRSGSTAVLKAAWSNGWNYICVVHNLDGGVSYTTNYVDWVYEPVSTALALTGSTSTALTLSGMTGTFNMSGVKYFTGGALRYANAISNVYNSTYSNSASAFSVTPSNITHFTTLFGSGITTSTSSSNSVSLPALNTSAGSEQTLLIITAATNISATKLIPTTNVSYAVTCAHPITTRSISTPQTSTMNGFLMYNVTDTEGEGNENFTAESKRLVSGNYTGTNATYANVQTSNLSAWTSTQDLVTGDTAHNTGLLMYNNILCYPNSATHSYNNGNFRTVAEGGTVTNSQGPSGNVNYSSASGVRDFYRKFKSAAVSSLGSLSFSITKIAGTTFSTNGSTTNPSPSSDVLVLECAVIKTTSSKYGWFNPLATSNNAPSDVANTASAGMASTTLTFSCTLGSSFTVDSGDLIIVRIKSSSTWSGNLSNIQITNI